MLIAFTLFLGFTSQVQAVETSKYKKETLGLMEEGIKLLRSRKLKGAKEKFAEVIKLEPTVPDAYNNLGLAYAYENQMEKAVANYRKALDIEPLYLPALNNLGLVLYSQGKAEEALYYWRLCLKMTPGQEPELNYYVGNALRDLGQMAEARKHYLQAIKESPGFAAAYSGLAALELSEGRLDEASRAVNQAIKLKKDSAFAYYHLGLIEEKRGRNAQALAAYRASLQYEKVPQYKLETQKHISRLAGEPVLVDGGTSPLLKLEALLKRKAWADASAYIGALRQSGMADDPVLLNALGLCYINLDQVPKACEAYRRALLLKNEPFPEAQFNLGMALRKAGDSAGSEAAFRKAIEDSAQLKKTNFLAQNMLGIVLREKGDYQGADRAFRRAILQSAGELPVAHYNLGLLLEKNERSRDAVQEYRAYLKLAPRGKNVALVKAHLKRLTGGL